MMKKSVKRKLAALLAAVLVMNSGFAALAGPEAAGVGGAPPEQTVAEGSESGKTEDAAKLEQGSLTDRIQSLFDIPETTESETNATKSQAADGTLSDGALENAGSETAKDETFTVVYTISPEGAAECRGKESVKQGKTLSFSVKPKAGYQIAEVHANGLLLEGKKNLLGTSWRYEIADVNEDYSIEIAMEETPQLMRMKQAATASEAIYVAGNGDDETGKGTAEAPYASLAKAAETINQTSGKTYTVYVMSDLEATETARFYNNAIKLRSAEGETFTITRQENFKTINDPERSFYNGALIEIGKTSAAAKDFTAKLEIEDLVLDDNGLHEGKIFMQAPQNAGGGSTTGNTDYVQDAMIDAYSGSADIILGQGAVLKNFGGMSAVRITGDSSLVMKDGSKITEDLDIARTKSGAVKKETGAAGAIWSQSGSVTLENGAEITDINGCGIYADGGSVVMNGKIDGIKPNTQMWQGVAGLALHARNKAAVKLGENSVIQNINGAGEGKEIVVYAEKTKEVKLEGLIRDCDKLRHAVALNQTPASFSGHITNCTQIGSNGYAVALQEGDFTFTKDSLIDACDSGVSTVYVQAGANVDFYGKIADNTAKQCGGFHMYGQFAGFANENIVVNMYDGAEIVNNKVTGSARGGAVGSGGSSHERITIFNMYGGLISGNETPSLFSSGAVHTRKNGQFYLYGGEITGNTSIGVKLDNDSGLKGSQFIMEGGKITDNEGQAVSVSLGNENYAELTGGTISGNNKGSYQISATGGASNNKLEYIKIKEGVAEGNTANHLSFGDVTLQSGYGEISLGRPLTAVKDAMQAAITKEPDHAAWTIAGNGLWLRSMAESVQMEVTAPAGVDKALGLYYAYVPLNEDGTVQENAEVKLSSAIPNEETLKLELSGLKPGTAYALMLVHNTSRTLKPADTVLYTGGTAGGTDTSGLPNPDSYLLEGLPSWIKTVEVNGTALEGSTTELKAQLHDMFRERYLNPNTGETLTDDTVPGVYDIELTYAGNGKTRSAAVPVQALKINGNDISVTRGKLIIREVNEKDSAKAGTLMHTILAEAPAEANETASVVAPKSATYYINGNTNRKVSETAGISSLEDSLFAAEETAVSEKIAADTENFPTLSTAEAYQFDASYLDLVDTANGNVYVTASSWYGKPDIYLAYPEGKSFETEGFAPSVLYLAVNRDYSLNGAPDMETALSGANAVLLPAEKTQAGIKVTAKNADIGGIYAVVWKDALYRVTVNYLEKGTDAKLAEPDTVSVPSGKAYDVTEKVLPFLNGQAYKFVETSGDALTGTADADKTINCYYEKNTGSIKISYRDIDSRADIKEVYETELVYGSSYDVSALLSPEIAGYRYVKTEPEGQAASGTFTGGLVWDSYYKEVHPPVFTTESLPDGMEGEAYETTVAAKGDAVIEFVIKSDAGKLPKGLSLSLDGKLTGTPEEAGDFAFTVIAKNDVGEAVKEYKLHIEPRPVKQIVVRYVDINDPGLEKPIAADAVVEAKLGSAYDVTEQTKLAIDGYRFVKVDPNHDAPTGTADGDKLIVVYYKVANPPLIVTEKLPWGYEGDAYTAKVEASGDPEIKFEITGTDKLPAWLSLSADGTLSGTLKEAGTFRFTVRAYNTYGEEDKREFELEVKARAPKEITVRYLDINDPNMEKPLAPDYQTEVKFEAAYDVTEQTKLAIDGYRFVKVDPNHDAPIGTADGDKLIVVYYKVANPPLIVTEKLPWGYEGDAYIAKVEASGDPEIKFEITGTDKLPAWLSLSADGTLSGTLKEAGTFRFTVRAYNTYGEEDKREFELEVKARAPKEITVRYLDINDPNMEKPLAPDYQTEVKFEAAYDVTEQTKLAIDGYRFVKVDPNHDAPTGTADGDKLIVVYYEKTNPPLIVTEQIPDGIEGDSYETQIVVIGDPIVKLEVTGMNELPAWLKLTEDGKLTGTLGKAGDYPFTLGAYNDRGEEDKVDFVLHVLARGAKQVVIHYLDADTNTELAAAYQMAVAYGAAYDVSEAAKKEIEGYTYVETVGSVTGTAEDDVEIRLYYRKNAPVPKPAAPVITTENLPGGKTGTLYSVQLAASGDTPIRFALTDGKLPDGLSLTESGLLSGTPGLAGTYTFTVTAANAAGTDSKVFALVIEKKTSGGGGGSSSSGSGGVSYTAGFDGRWVHMDPENADAELKKEVPQGMTPISAPNWHTWKFYLYSGGILKDNWAYIRNPYALSTQPQSGWFHFDQNGIMQYGWYMDAKTGKWYYLHRESDGMLGCMETGWHFDAQDNQWYYLSTVTGEMLTGWQQIDGKWYYFNEKAPEATWTYEAERGGWTFNGSSERPYGAMYRNEQTPDGHTVDENGVRKD